MFAGHFGLAAGVKARDTGLLAKRRMTGSAKSAPVRPDVPLWALMLSAQLLDVGFAFLVIARAESFGGGGGYGVGWIQAYYTHSLAGALLIAAIAGLLAAQWWGQQ